MAKLKKNTVAEKPKAARADIVHLQAIGLYQKTFTSGKRGFFGKVMDPATGKRYQITAAVELAG